MRHVLILAGGSGTRLWPMSRQELPKQLIPFVNGRSLLQLALERVGDLVPAEHRWICAAAAHADSIARSLPAQSHRFLGEPCGRDTLNAIGFAAAVIAREDPAAVMAVLTADHLIEPDDRFRDLLERAFSLVDRHPETLLTFGVEPTGPATGYGYLELGDPVGEARRVRRFREKPAAATASQYYEAGKSCYLWNSGMFVWRADALLEQIRRHRPGNHEGLRRVAAAWENPEALETIERIYPALEKISIDYGVMEPASADPATIVAALPLGLRWLDVGSWPPFAETCERDEAGNAFGGGLHLLLDTRRALVASSDPGHLIAAIGCDDFIVIHTPEATLVCPASRAEEIKELHKLVGERVGKEFV